MTTAIIIPTYNEGEAVERTVHELLDRPWQDRMAVIVVDDGSIDDTQERLQSLPVYFLRHSVNLGQGAALQTGMDFARRLQVDAAIHFDADGQHSPDDIPALLSALQSNHADVVLGSRFLRPEDTQLVPRKKRILLRLARIVNGFLTGLWLSDAHNGLRALNANALDAIHLHENRMAHATEILTQIRRHHLRFVEIPVTIRYTEYAIHKGQKISNAFNILIDVLLRKISG